LDELRRVRPGAVQPLAGVVDRAQQARVRLDAGQLRLGGLDRRAVAHDVVQLVLGAAGLVVAVRLRAAGLAGVVADDRREALSGLLLARRTRPQRRPGPPADQQE